MVDTSPTYLLKVFSHTKTYTKLFIAACLKEPKLETIQMSSNKWMDKQTVVCPCNGILFSKKKEFDYHHNIDEYQNNYTRWKQTKNTLLFHLYNVL